MLLLQTAYLTAIAMLVEKQSAVRANRQHEKWVCTAAGVSISHWGGLLLLRELHPAPLPCRNCSSNFCGKIHISIPPRSSKSRRSLNSLLVLAWLRNHNVYYRMLYLVWTETIKKLLNIIFIKIKPMELGKEVFSLLSGLWVVVDRQRNIKREMSFFPGPFIKRPCPSQNLGNVVYFLRLAVEVSLSVIASISRLWHCADLSPRACI